MPEQQNTTAVPVAAISPNLLNVVNFFKVPQNFNASIGTPENRNNQTQQQQQNEIQLKAELAKIPRFHEECTPDAVCVYVGFEVNSFNNAERNIVLYFFDEKQQKGDFWRGSLSTQYAPTQNDTSECKTYLQKTFDQLEKLIEINRQNVTWAEIITKLQGKTFPIWCAKKTSNKTGKEYVAIAALGNGGFSVAAPIGIPTDMNLGALLQGQAAPTYTPPAQNAPFPNLPPAQPAQQQAAPQADAVNPFAKLQ